MAVTSSVPRVTSALRQMASRWFDVPCVVLEPGVRSGMPILYDNPKEVGADRIANAIGAYDLYGGPCIVVDLGTATTFDAISATGEYLGGAIAPGIAISMDALFHHAAALRRVELVEPRSVIGKSTVESIQSGALYGYAAQVDGMCRRIMDELGHAHGGRHRRAVGDHRPAVADHRAPRAVAHPARAAPRLRTQLQAGVIGGCGERRRDPVASRPVADVPYSFERTDEAAALHERYGALGAGEETDDNVSVAGRVMLVRPQGRLAFATLRDSSGQVQLFAARRRSPPTSRPSPSCRSGTGWGRRARSCARAKGNCRCRCTRGCSWPRPGACFGDKWKGVSDVETRFRQREVDLWANERTRDILTPAQPPAQLGAPAPRGCGLRRGGDAGPPRHPGRRHGQALRHPSQRPGRRSVPAHRARAVSQAPRRGRLREGVRDRPGLPQRRAVAPPQSRVHDARALSGLRRLQGLRRADRGPGVGARVGVVRAPPSSRTRVASSTSPRRGGAPPWPSS